MYAVPLVASTKCTIPRAVTTTGLRRCAWATITLSLFPSRKCYTDPVPTTYIACIVRTDQSYAAILVAAGWIVVMAVAAISVATIAAALIVAIVRTC